MLQKCSFPANVEGAARSCWSRRSITALHHNRSPREGFLCWTQLEGTSKYYYYVCSSSSYIFIENIYNISGSRSTGAHTFICRLTKKEDHTTWRCLRSAHAWCWPCSMCLCRWWPRLMVWQLQLAANWFPPVILLLPVKDPPSQHLGSYIFSGNVLSQELFMPIVICLS